MYLLNNSFIECIVRSLNLFSCASISHLATVLLFFCTRRKKTISIYIFISCTLAQVPRFHWDSLSTISGWLTWSFAWVPRFHWDSFEYHQWLVTLKPISINSGTRPTINRLLELIYKLQVVCALRRQTSAEFVHFKTTVLLLLASRLSFYEGNHLIPSCSLFRWLR